MDWSFSAHNSLSKCLIKSYQVYEVDHALPILLFIFDPDRDKVMPCFRLIHISYEFLLKQLLRLFIGGNLCPDYLVNHLVFEQLEGRDADRSALKKLTREAALLEILPWGSGRTKTCFQRRKAPSCRSLTARTQGCLMTNSPALPAKLSSRSCLGKFDLEGQTKGRLISTHMSSRDCWSSWFWFISRQLGPCVCLAFRCQQFWRRPGGKVKLH